MLSPGQPLPFWAIVRCRPPLMALLSSTPNSLAPSPLTSTLDSTSLFHFASNSLSLVHLAHPSAPTAHPSVLHGLAQAPFADPSSCLPLLLSASSSLSPTSLGGTAPDPPSSAPPPSPSSLPSDRVSSFSFRPYVSSSLTSVLLVAYAGIRPVEDT